MEQDQAPTTDEVLRRLAQLEAEHVSTQSRLLQTEDELTKQKARTQMLETSITALTSSLNELKSEISHLPQRAEYNVLMKAVDEWMKKAEVDVARLTQAGESTDAVVLSLRTEINGMKDIIDRWSASEAGATRVVMEELEEKIRRLTVRVEVLEEIPQPTAQPFTSGGGPFQAAGGARGGEHAGAQHGPSGGQQTSTWTKRISEDKNKMDGIDKCESAHDVARLVRRVKVMCSDRYPHVGRWLEFLGSLHTSPTEDAVSRWASTFREEADRMTEDVWGILTVKVTGTLSELLYHAMTLGGTPLTRTSRAWYALLRDSRGRLADRKSALSDRVFAPVRLKQWGDVASAFRAWEIDMAEFEIITNNTVDSSLRTTALLRMLPVDLKERVQSQDGLEGEYDRVRDYVLNQVGRWTGESRATRSSGSAPMDLSNVDHVDESSSAGDLNYFPRKGHKGKQRSGKPTGGKSGRCYVCGSGEHLAMDCPKQNGKNSSPMQCFNCNGFGHRASACPSHRETRSYSGGKGGKSSPAYGISEEDAEAYAEGGQQCGAEPGLAEPVGEEIFLS